MSLFDAILDYLCWPKPLSTPVTRHTEYAETPLEASVSHANDEGVQSPVPIIQLCQLTFGGVPISQIDPSTLSAKPQGGTTD